jgi:hypothetical protein
MSEGLRYPPKPFDCSVSRRRWWSVELVAEGALADTEQLRGAGAIAACGRERALDRPPLDGLEVVGRRPGVLDRPIEIAGLEGVLAAEENGPLDRVGQLAHVSRPGK